MNNLLDLLNSISDNANMFNVNDNCNVITDKLDFTKKSDLDKLKESVKKLKDEKNPWVSCFRLIGGNDYDAALDCIITEAQKIYDDAHKNDDTRKVVDKSVISPDETRPSEKVSEEMKKQITKLTVEYMNDVIIPNYKNIKTEQAVSIHDALFEFACWIYSK